jgi:hypothetical protein
MMPAVLLVILMVVVPTADLCAFGIHDFARRQAVEICNN